MSEFEKDLGKKKEGTDTLNQNQENSTKPAVPAEGEKCAGSTGKEAYCGSLPPAEQHTETSGRKPPAGRSETGKTERQFRHAGKTDNKCCTGSAGKGS